MFELFAKINALIDEHYLVMIEQRGNEVYLLKKHYSYLNPEREAEREFIGEGKVTDQEYLYITHKFPTLTRTKH